MRTASTALALLLASPVFAQGTRPGITLTGLPSVVRQGERIMATLRIESPDEVSNPRIATVDGLRIAIGGPSHQTRQFFDRGVHTISVSTSFAIEITPLQRGTFKVPPIEFTVGGKKHATGERVLEVVENVSGKNFGRLTVALSRKRVYVHQPLHFRFDCAIDSGLELASRRATTGEPFYVVQLEVDWLAEKGMDGGELMDVSNTDTNRPKYIVMNRAMLQPADVKVIRGVDGKSQRVFSFLKSILPTRTGPWRLSAPLMRFTVLTTRHRDIFGTEVRGTKEYVVTGKPIAVEILPLPKKGRPDPFFGAVGQFGIDAKIDQRSVHVGGSIKLTLTISGQGNMDHLQVPELTDLPGLHRLGKIENRTKDSVVVTYDLSPKTAEVERIERIAWNYFDTTPGVEKYVAIETEPLTIDVRPIAGETALSNLPGEKPKSVEPGVDDIFDVKLSSGSAVVASAAAPAPDVGVTILWSMLPWVLCACGMFFRGARRRSLADVQGRRARGAARKFHAAIAGGDDPLGALVAYLADRLGCEPAAVIGSDLASRLTATGVDLIWADKVQQLIDQGVAARYGGGGSGVDRSLVIAAVDALEHASTRVGTGALWLLTAALAGAPLTGQGLSKAEEAYRSGDYTTAAVGFRAASNAGDRRASYNLGNALFRQGRFARSLAAYEKARLAMPRDEELLANIRLVRERLDLGSAEGEAFSQTVAAIRDSFTPMERFWMCILCNGIASLLICFGGRRLRILGLVCALPALVMIIEVAILLPSRPPRGIVIEPMVAVRAEPSAELAPLMHLRGGVAVEVLGAGSQSKWTQVRVEGRKGYLPSAALIVVE